MINDVHEHRLLVFSCESSKYFAEKIVESLNKINAPEEPEIVLSNLEITHFSDGEFQTQYVDSVRGAECFIIQSTFQPCENLMELLLAIDAAKRASANKVTAVIPYYGWARQDRKDKPRVSIGAKLVANMLKAAGTDAVMTCDLHADQIQGYFDFPVNHLYADSVFGHILRALLENYPDTLTLAAPDMGSAKRVHSYAKKLGLPVVICHKTRARANIVESIHLVGIYPNLS